MKWYARTPTSGLCCRQIQPHPGNSLNQICSEKTRSEVVFNFSGRFGADGVGAMEILNYLQMHSVRRAEFVLKRSHPRSRIISNRKRFSVSAIISLGLLFLGCGGVATAQIQPGQLMQPAPAATASLTPPINTDYEPITIEGRM